MKNIFKLAAIAIVALSLTVACKSKTETVEDTMPIDTLVMDTIDTIEEVAEEVVVEEPVKKEVKKAVAKEEAPKATTKSTEVKDKNLGNTLPSNTSTGKKASGVNTADETKATGTALPSNTPAKKKR